MDGPYIFSILLPVTQTVIQRVKHVTHSDTGPTLGAKNVAQDD